MKRHVFVSLITAIVSAGAAFGPLQAAMPVAALRAAGVAADDAGAAVSLNLSAKVPYQAASARNPDRVILTLHRARAAAGLALLAAQGVIMRTRSQQQANGD